MSQSENGVIAKVNEFHEELKKLHYFASQEIIPKLNTWLQQHEASDKDNALAYTYIRMFLTIGSIIKLDDKRDFQTLASASRTAFELWIDMHLLDKEMIGNGFDKFKSFEEAKKFSIAESDKNWSKDNNYPFSETFPKREKYLEEMRGKGIPEKIQQLWGQRKSPNHWSNLSARERVAKLGNDFIEKYMRLYYMGNWHIHSGPLNWKALEDGSFADTIAGYTYGSASEMFQECCKICVDHFSLQLSISNK